MAFGFQGTEGGFLCSRRIIFHDLKPTLHGADTQANLIGSLTPFNGQAVMGTNSTSKRTGWSHLAWAIGGAVFGSWLTRSQAAEAKKSRAELDDPEGAEEVYFEMRDLIDAWEPHEACETEDDFAQDLAAYLEESSDWEIEVSPNTREGKPDVLIGDLLALELKYAPSKGEFDRAIGQCAAYSRQWITWLIIIDARASEIGRFHDLLLDKGLEQIEIWHFS